MSSVEYNADVLLRLLSNYIEDNKHLFPTDVYKRKYDLMYEQLNARLVGRKELLEKLNNELDDIKNKKQTLEVSTSELISDVLEELSN